jgi:hypothetical protein
VLDAAFTSFPRQVLSACWAACQGTEPDALRGSLLFLREQLLPARAALEDEAGRPASLAATVLATSDEGRAWLLDVLARPQKGAPARLAGPPARLVCLLACARVRRQLARAAASRSPTPPAAPRRRAQQGRGRAAGARRQAAAAAPAASAAAAAAAGASSAAAAARPATSTGPTRGAHACAAAVSGCGSAAAHGCIDAGCAAGPGRQRAGRWHRHRLAPQVGRCTAAAVP